MLQFKEISHAYEVLSDAKKRDLYDRGGEQAIKEGGMQQEFHNPMDMFDMLFGGRGGGGRRYGPTKGKDVVHQLSVSLEDLYNGTTRKLALQKNVICNKCDGKGFNLSDIFHMTLAFLCVYLITYVFSNSQCTLV